MLNKAIILLSLIPTMAFANLGGNRQGALNSWGPPVWQKGNLMLYLVQGTYIEETYDTNNVCQSVVFVRSEPFTTNLSETLDQLNLPTGLVWTQLPSTDPNYIGWSLNNGAYYVTSFKAIFNNQMAYWRSYATPQGVIMTGLSQ